MPTSDPVAKACTLLEQAEDLRAAGDSAAALKAAKRALAIFEKHDGPKSPDAANALTVVSSCTHDCGDYDEALATAERAWKILRPLRDEGNVDLDRLKLLALGSLGQARIARGEYARAGKVHALALPIAKGLGGGDLAAVLNSLGIVCKYLGHFTEGRRRYLRALALLEELHGTESIALCAVLHNLGGLEHSQGRFARGVPYARRGLAIRRGAQSASHPDIAADAAALAALLDGCGERVEARTLYDEALAIYRKVHGPKHFEVGFNLANVAALEHGEGRLDEAARLYTEALAIEESALGKHPYVALTLQNLGLLRVEQGKVAEGRRLVARAVALYIETLGKGHPDTKAAAENLRTLKKL